MDDPIRDALVALYIQVFAEAPYRERHLPAQVLESTWQRYIPHGLFVATHDALLLGFSCAMRLSEHPDASIVRFVGRQPDFGGEASKTVYMAELAVAPGARGTGLGDRLVDARLQWARSRGLSWFVMRTDPHRSSSAALYIRRGGRPLSSLQLLEGGTASPTRRFFWGEI